MGTPLKRTRNKPKLASQFKFNTRKQVHYDQAEADRLKREWLESHEPTKLPPGFSRVVYEPA